MDRKRERYALWLVLQMYYPELKKYDLQMQILVSRNCIYSESFNLEINSPWKETDFVKGVKNFKSK